ncbi:MAG TPA: hypothetical protein DCR93_13990 [Cytophagales bacterium]|nr:hypothetical protein [Cytophagales bacterium]
MRTLRIILFSLFGLLALVSLVAFGYYRSMEPRERAEFWYQYRKGRLQGDTQRQWFMGQAIKADPTFAQAYMQKSIAHTKRGDFATGMLLLNQAVDLEPVTYLGYRGYVKLYMLHDYKGALADYHRLDSLTPSFRDAPWSEDIYHVIGLAYMQLGDDANAMKYLDLADDPEAMGWVDDQVYLYRGMVQVRQGNYAVAITEFKKSIEANHFSDQYFHLAQAYFQVDSLPQGCTMLAEGQAQMAAGYVRSNAYYELPGQVYSSDFQELAAKYCGKE